MIKHFLLAGAVLLTAACSSPKYTYNFDHYNYNSGKKQTHPSVVQTIPTEAASPLALHEEDLTASTGNTPVALAENTTSNTAKAKVAVAKYRAMSKTERKAFRKELTKEVKAYAKATKKGEHVKTTGHTQVMDQDLKLSIIFGAIGLTLVLLGTVNTVFWVLGVVSLIVGIVFLINWLSRQ